MYPNVLYITLHILAFVMGSVLVFCEDKLGLIENAPLRLRDRRASFFSGKEQVSLHLLRSGPKDQRRVQ
eukprot:IDg17468t1